MRFNNKVVRSMQCHRTDQSIHEYFAGFDPLRRNAQSRTEMDAGFPGQFVSMLRRTICLDLRARQEKSSVMASSHMGEKFDEAAARMRRLCGSRGGSGHQDASITGEVVGPLESDGDQEASVAYKKAEKRGVGQEKTDGFLERGGDKERRGRANICWFQPPHKPAT